MHFFPCNHCEGTSCTKVHSVPRLSIFIQKRTTSGDKATSQKQVSCKCSLTETVTWPSPGIFVSMRKVNSRKYLNFSKLLQAHIGQQWSEWHNKWSAAQGNRLNAKVFVPSEIDLMIMPISFGAKLPVGYFLIDLLAISDCCLIYAYFQRHLMNPLFIINHSKFYPMWNICLHCLGQLWLFLLPLWQ